MLDIFWKNFLDFFNFLDPNKGINLELSEIKEYKDKHHKKIRIECDRRNEKWIKMKHTDYLNNLRKARWSLWWSGEKWVKVGHIDDGVDHECVKEFWKMTLL